MIMIVCTIQSNYKLQKKLADEQSHLATEMEELKQQQTNSQEQVDAKTENIQQNQKDSTK